MPFPEPSMIAVKQFIIQNNALERLTLTQDELEDTLQRKFLHPLAAGHFAAFNYVKKLAQDNTWPAKHPVQFEHEQKSFANTEWLRTLHEKLMRPIAEYGDVVSQYLDPKNLGNYRITPRLVGYRKMPPALSVRKLMHHWYSQLGRYHLSVLPKLKSQSITTVKDLNDHAYNFHIMLQCIKPWHDGSGRSSRLIENALRLRWYLPLRTYKEKDTQSYANDIMAFEDSSEWQNTLKVNNAVA